MVSLIGADACARLLDRRELMDALESAHVAHHRADLVLPLPTALSIPGHDEVVASERPRHVLMSAADRDLTVVKVLLDAPARRGDEGPRQRSVILAFDTSTGDLVAQVDGREVTRRRTAVATMLAVRALAAPGWRTLGVLGAGALAREHIRSAHELFGASDVVVWSRTSESADAVVTDAASAGISVRLADTPGAVAAEVDVLITVTPAREPLIHARDLRPGQHVSAVGSPPRPTFRELAPDVFVRADVVVVDALDVAAAESGQVRAALAAGLPRKRVHEIGAVLARAATGRTHRDQITVHSSIGLALQDLAAVRLLLGRDAAARH